MINVEQDFVLELLQTIAKYDAHEDLYWKPDLTFAINCNDVFYWGCADAEYVKAEDLALLEQSYRDVEEVDGCYGGYLYCARKRGERPRGAMYKHLTDGEKPLFDACGPKREVGFGNPKDRNDF